MNPLTPFDLIPLPSKEKFEYNAGQQVEFIKEMHERTRKRLEQHGRLMLKGTTSIGGRCNSKKVTLCGCT